MAVQLIDFEEDNRVAAHGYRGSALRKLAYLHDNVVWMVKFSPRNFVGVYVSSPLGEYIGSHVYEALGIPVHKTVLGRYEGRIVVACEDFAVDSGMLDYHQIKNTVDEELIFGCFGSSSRGERLSDALRVIDNAKGFASLRDEVKNRFWDMFVVDAFILNGGRNNESWGLVRDYYITSLVPVFGNGKSFFSKNSLLSVPDDTLIEQDAFSRLSFFTDDNDRHIHAWKYIESMENPDCTAALVRFASRLDMNKIRAVIEDIPEKAFNLEVISPEQKAYCIQIMETIIEKSINPTLNKLGVPAIDLETL